MGCRVGEESEYGPAESVGRENGRRSQLVEGDHINAAFCFQGTNADTIEQDPSLFSHGCRRLIPSLISQKPVPFPFFLLSNRNQSQRGDIFRPA
jgi:hypothetical protein